MKIWIFPPLAFVWPSKHFLAFLQISWPSDILNIQNHSNFCYFEAILQLKQFLLKIWQTGSVWIAGVLGGSEKGQSLISAYWSIAITTNTPGSTALSKGQLTELLNYYIYQSQRDWGR